MEQAAKIYVAGHNGLVGSALVRTLKQNGYQNIIDRSSAELDLRDQKAVNRFFEINQPEYVFLAAAKVGGIWANQSYPAQFIYDNLMIEANVIHASYLNKVKKLLFLGSSCIYPKFAEQPIKEEALLTGELESSNKAYAIAKIAGIEMCRAYNQQYGTNYIAVMPTNLYGPNDNFDLENSHVLPALIRKFHEAKINGSKEVKIWGTGKAVREFLYVDDLAEACLFLMRNYDDCNQIINIGCGEGITISDLALLVKKIVGFEGEIVYDTSKPDGTPVKINDISRIQKLGWKPKVSLEEGIRSTYNWYVNREGKFK
ncbi:MAG TPA: GDP-L-fucose synthase [Bacillota bacterium]|jgi:GDP-L-fucose synthase|nr:GDP-L-fucose synthase [Bacillota bacterium]